MGGFLQELWVPAGRPPATVKATERGNGKWKEHLPLTASVSTTKDNPSRYAFLDTELTGFKQLCRGGRWGSRFEDGKMEKAGSLQHSDPAPGPTHSP